jgi:uncharacterized protein (DUF1499 family)
MDEKEIKEIERLAEQIAVNARYLAYVNDLSVYMATKQATIHVLSEQDGAWGGNRTRTKPHE